MEALTVSMISSAIAVGTFIFTLVDSKRKASVSKVTLLEQKVIDIQMLMNENVRRLDECEKDRFQLREMILHKQRGK